MPVEMNSKKWFTVKEAAELYGCSRPNIQRWLREGIIPQEETTFVGNTRLIEQAALVNAINKIDRNRRPKSPRGSKQKKDEES